MKKVQIFFIISVCCLAFIGSQAFAQNKADCQEKLRELISEGNRIKPDSREHNELSRICDRTKIPDEVKKESDWKEIKDMLREMIKIVEKVNEKKIICNASICREVERYKDRIDALKLKE